MQERKAATLARCEWWRTVRDDRDQIIRDARDAGNTIADIVRAMNLAKNTVLTVLKDHPESAQEATVSPLAQFHHPHYVSHERRRGRSGWTFAFRPFTGTEVEPRSPKTWDLEPPLSDEDRQLIHAEYEAARDAWVEAAFRHAITPAIHAARPEWDRYAAARAEMDRIHRSFDNLPDDRWKSTTLNLIRAQDAALAAAMTWDETAEGMAAIANRFSEPPRTADVAAELGIRGAADWVIGDYYAYARDDYEEREHFTPLAAAVYVAIEAQRQELKKAAETLGA